MKPFFSIVIPTYNRADLLRNTLHTVLKQDFESYEVIIVDDGSTDHTRLMIEQEFVTNPRLQYIQKINEERSVARNVGIKASKGEFIVFFDSDDNMHTDHLSKLYQAIILQPTCDLFACKYQLNRNGKIIPHPIQNLPEGIYDYRLLLKGSLFGVLICIRKQLSDFQYFESNFNILEDWIFNLLNLRKDRKIFVLNHITMTVNDHDQRSMAQNSKVIKARLQAMEYLLPKLRLSTTEVAVLKGHSYEFCAIHAYIDGNRRDAFRFWKRSRHYLGVNQSLVMLLLKILIGKNIINLIKK